MPGRFLSRKAHDINPGANYVRIALVSSLDECREALNRIKCLIQEFSAKIEVSVEGKKHE